MEAGTCGLRGTVHVSNVVSSADKLSQRFCHGSMTDWDSERCRGQSQLWLSLTGPCGSKFPRRRVDNSSVHRQGINTVSIERFELYSCSGGLSLLNKHFFANFPHRASKENC